MEPANTAAMLKALKERVDREADIAIRRRYGDGYLTAPAPCEKKCVYSSEEDSDDYEELVLPDGRDLMDGISLDEPLDNTDRIICGRCL